MESKPPASPEFALASRPSGPHKYRSPYAIALVALSAIAMFAVTLFGLNVERASASSALTVFDTDYCSGLEFTYTGADETFTVPPGATQMYVKVWGAGGSSDGAADGGPGAYVEGVLTVTAGTDYTVVVGSRGGTGSASGFYGFGGAPYSLGGSGGGLGGLFTGNAPVGPTDQARALLIAGGGGGAERTAGGNGGTVNGGTGGDPAFAGGNAGTMEGAPGLAQASGFGSGGGSGAGFTGGVAHQRNAPTANTFAGGGGTNFIDASVTSALDLFTPDGTGFDPPNQSDIHYVAKVGQGYTSSAHPDGPGLVIVQFDDNDNDPNCAPPDTDGDGIADADENPGEDTDPCLDPSHPDWVQQTTNDCDGDGSTIADGDTDDADPCAAPGDTNWVALPTRRLNRRRRRHQRRRPLHRSHVCELGRPSNE